MVQSLILQRIEEGHLNSSLVQAKSFVVLLILFAFCLVFIKELVNNACTVA